MPIRTREKKITQAWFEAPNRGHIELAADWRGRTPPPLSLGPDAPAFTSITPVPSLQFARHTAYYIDHKTNEIHFCIWPENLPAEPRQPLPRVYLVGDHNEWHKAVGNPEWELHLANHYGTELLTWSGPAADFMAQPPKRFKFVTGQHQWLDVPQSAFNAVRDDTGNLNRQIDPTRTGLHVYQFTLDTPLDLAANNRAHWNNDPQATLRPTTFFTEHRTAAPLGAIPGKDETLFRIYAPRAGSVELCVIDDLGRTDEPHRYPLQRNPDHTWEITLSQNLHGWYYWYHIDGAQNEFTRFNPAQRILDPYALAAVDRDGPGIIIDRARLTHRRHHDHARFQTPAWQDLVICEAHVRDLIARAPIDLAPDERLTFAGLAKWVEHPDFYLHRLGVNAVELQPVQEFDNIAPGDYHWGYMTSNYFAPESSYSTDPARASGIHDLQQLVAAFHRRGMAVILDVVYNHVGEPAHLLHIDQLAYFHTNADGSLSNWSGCGNDINADSAMARRLIIDSLAHLVETFGVDGFRLDLAELLGIDALKEIEGALKKTKPDIILIAEPWSFKGHIAGALRDTGWASWNDGYRNFIREYVRGGSSQESYEYNLKGSPWHFAKFPAQTVNYSESHDDRCWLDVITENAGHNGNIPTYKDRRRTRLMASVLCMSLGIPMFSAGQDFLRSKQGVNNTYLRGDLNALDYTRILRFPSTHACFAEWIAFRRSPRGAILRHYTRPRDEFFRFFFAENSTAAATLYNADCEMGPHRLLFAINATENDITIKLPPEVMKLKWRQLADHDRFYSPGDPAHPYPAPAENLFLPPLSCVLWEAV
ncbi:pullulanase [Ereboglobus sp. PH5-10]|uniref:alpha-amylase family glycosyl hydrolase n=1 Tax=Ereboglobus sp. PH5-10 TaxID=2940629 RepID=UPI0024074DBA|nr:alpha-amylase family glycosyl hydrolase [Ereboglobus sp. PH5-10]MDF9826815.1 pullulanase [Ereboglobus sp. PH5-10]